MNESPSGHCRLRRHPRRGLIRQRYPASVERGAQCWRACGRPRPDANESRKLGLAHDVEVQSQDAWEAGRVDRSKSRRSFHVVHGARDGQLAKLVAACCRSQGSLGGHCPVNPALVPGAADRTPRLGSDSGDAVTMITPSLLPMIRVGSWGCQSEMRSAGHRVAHVRRGRGDANAPHSTDGIRRQVHGAHADASGAIAFNTVASVECRHSLR